MISRVFIGTLVEKIILAVFDAVYEVYGDKIVKIPPKKLASTLAPVLKEYEKYGRVFKKLYNQHKDDIEPYINVKFVLAQCKRYRPEFYSLLASKEGVKWLKEALKLVREWLENKSKV